MFTRTPEQRQRNNDTRALFKQAVIDIFGKTIDDVPKKVRDAMNLSKFDETGRPLTARRMLAVRRAIVLHAAIGKAPCGAEGGVARELLEANAALREKSGAVLCQDPETKAFAAIRPVPLQMADSDTLAEVVADLVQTATTLGSVFVYNGQQHAPLRISNRHLQPRTTPWAESTP